MLEILFAFIVTAAVIAVLFEPKRGGLLVMTLALGVAFYQLALIVGPSPWLGVFAVFVAACVKIIDEATGGNMLGNVSLAVAVDRVLTRMQGGGPPTQGGRDGTDGREQRREMRRMPPPGDDDD